MAPQNDHHNSIQEEAILRLAAIVESSDDAIFSKTTEGIITTWNKGAERIYGYSADEIIGKSVAVLIPPNRKNDFPLIMSKLKKGERIDHFETQRFTKDGRIIDVSITVSPLKNAQGKIIGASKIARDITEKKALERRKDDFISLASHELKTPVTSIKGYAQILKKLNSEDANPSVVKYLDKMDKQISKLTNLITDLLDVSKAAQGKLDYKDTMFSLDKTIEGIIEDIQHVTDTHQIIFEHKIPVSICGDQERIGQVIINLLTNAIKYSPDADRVVVRMESDAQTIKIRVQDFGMGIPPHAISKIFERFYRAYNEEQPIYSGLGIGLYISHEIVTRHNGSIEVDSKLGEGSTFILSLPYEK
jgi:PAS domain S-box-containing protein